MNAPWYTRTMPFFFLTFFLLIRMTGLLLTVPIMSQK